jgi:hypothetical protein
MDGKCSPKKGNERAPPADVLGCVGACFAAGLNLASEGGEKKKKKKGTLSIRKVELNHEAARFCCDCGTCYIGVF